jgi:hypothetical protein
VSTYNITVVPDSWIKIVDIGDTDFLVTWDTPTNVAFAATEVDEQPTVHGHQFPREKRITREDVGTGYVWAKLASTGIVASMQLVVSKTQSVVGSTGGFDMNEGVHKVAMLVWNPSTLSWERGTGTANSGGGGSTAISPKNKKFDQASLTVLYMGEAVPGAATSAPVWSVKRVTFGSDGLPASIDFAALGASTQVWDNRASLNY